MRIILKAREAIESSLSVIEGLTVHVNQILQEDRLQSARQEICIELEQFTRGMQMHKRSVATLAKYSQRLQTLVSKPHIHYDIRADFSLTSSADSC